MADGEQPSSMSHVKSTVSFAAIANDSSSSDDDDEHRTSDDGVWDEEKAPLVAAAVNGAQDDEIEMTPPAEASRTRVFSVSADRPITRIPTRVNMKTLTHKAKRPAIDIEFHDLTYAVKTTAGESFVRLYTLYQ